MPSDNRTIDRQRALIAACLIGLAVACSWHVAPTAVSATGAAALVAGVGWLLLQQFRVETATRATTRSVIRGVPVHLVHGFSACTAGPLRPRIFIGRGLLSSLDDDELHAVVLHERAHRARFDPLRASLSLVGQTVTPRSLLAPGAASRDKARREIIADHDAIRRGATRSALAASLLKVARAPSGSVGFVSADELRVRALVDELPATPPARPWLAPLAGTTLGAGFCVLGLEAALFADVIACCV